MNFRERINAVLHHGKPDMVPFAPYDNLIPRGGLAREMGNRGMGLVLRRSVLWSETPHVQVVYAHEDDVMVKTYVTPRGNISTRTRTHLGRIDDSGTMELDGLIKRPEDYDAVVAYIDDTVFHADHSIYFNAFRDVGMDGIVTQGGVGPAFEASRRYYGYVYGLDKWVYAQRDEPEKFAYLLEAMERQGERQFALLLDCPAEVIGLGSLNGQTGPKEFRQYSLPFYRRHVPQLKARGKITTLHAHASNVSVFAELIAQTGVDVVEALTPPPIGDLSVADARKAWGPNTIIWVNFPETVFLYGAQDTKDYTLELLHSDPHPDRLVIGMTEMGTFGATDPESERAFTQGLRALMSAIEEFSAAVF